MKRSVLELFRSRLPAPVRCGLLVFCLTALVAPGAHANPQGGKVISGNAEIAEALGKLTVRQGSGKAIIEWESFSIDAGEITQFIQPGSNATALNRVMGVSPSVLNGILKANGNVWLINQNGVVVGPNGMIDVGGFMASTLEMDNDDFLRGGDLALKGSSEAAVQNFGTIKAASGDIFLVGRTVENHGVLGAFEGTVGLAAGNSVLIKAKGAGDERIFVSAGEGSVTNAGEIRSAVTELKAHGNAYALAINNPGAVRATGTSQQGGRVFLKAASGQIISQGEVTAENADGSGGSIEMANGAGEIQIGGIVSASGSRGAGGAVTVSGAGVELLENSRVEANGMNGAGGRVEINGGEVALLRNSTLGANGETNGGTLSVGGSSRVAADGLLSARGITGTGGTVSVVGTSLTLGSEASVVTDGAVKGGTVEMSAPDAARIGGMISANGADGGKITLEAGRSLEVAGYILAIGNGAVGGRIDVESGQVALVTGAALDVSGRFRGGELNVGGSFQGKADPAVRNSLQTLVAEGVGLRSDSSLGHAGQVVIWSDGTTGFAGAISAEAKGALGRGGRIEVSGKQDLMFRGAVSAAAVSGQSGSVLFDPGDVYIGGSASNIPIASLNTILQGKTDVIVATESGSIFVQDIGLADNRHNAVQWTSDASLGLFASGNIYITNHIRTSGAGSVNLIAGWKGSEADLFPLTPLADFGATDVGVSTALSLDIGSFLAAGTVLPAGSVLNGLTLTTSQTLPNTPVTAATTIAVNGTIAEGSILAGPGSFRPNAPAGSLSAVERNWKAYVENKEFGDEGTILIGRADLGRHVEVGSRYGNTNLAANTLLMAAAQTNSDQLWTQLGFHDSGVVFVPQAAGTGGRGVDVHDTLNNNIVQSVRQTGNSLDPSINIDTRLAVAVEANATGRNDLPPVTITLRDSGADSAVTRAIRVGDIVTGTGILPHTYVTAINGDVITLSKPTSGVAMAVDTFMTFSRPGNAAVATVGQFEVDRLAYNASGSQVTNSTFDPTNVNAPAPDGIVDGVLLVDQTGPVAGTFMAYANHFNNQSQGNWWWQRIEAAGSPERTGGVGANRPEFGAGLSASSRADINVILTGRLSMEAGGRQNNAVQIGHGGIGTTANASRSYVNAADPRSVQTNSGTGSDGVNQSLLTPTLNSYALNGAGSGMVNQSIGRLAPIYSHINVIAGADLTKPVVYNPSASNPADILKADVVAGQGDVLLRGRQFLTSSNGGSATSPNNEIEYAYAQIGHLGAGQFGSVRGDIKVLAGGDVTLQAGRQSYAWATIGHTFGGRLNDWNNPSNGDAQIRIFSNPTDFDNPNWRVGELFAQPVVNGSGQLQVGTAAARGAYPVSFDPVAAAVGAVPNVQRTAGYWDVNFQTTPNQTQWASTTGNSGNTAPGATATDPRVPLADYLAFPAGRGRSASGPVTPTSVGIPALMGLTDKTIVGNVTVNSSGANGVTMLSGFTDDLGGSTLSATLTPDVGSQLAAGTQLPVGSVLNGVAQATATTLAVTTPVTSTTTIAIGGFIAPGSDIRTDAVGTQLTLDNKSIYVGRVTQIGHGGVAVQRGDIGGWTTTLAVFGSSASSFDSGSRDMVNLAGTALDANLGGGTPGTANRQVTGLNLIGDVQVRALVGGVALTAGNHLYDYAQIGHGGAEVADLESSSMAVGDVTVFAKTNLSIRGSGVEYTGNSATLPLRSYAKVGHGGYLDGFYYKAGDISVTAETGDLTMVAGRLQGQYAQIGHSGISSWGQVGGNLDRQESFSFTNRSTRFDIPRSATMELVAGVPTITLSGGVNGIASGGLTLNTYGNTANIDVTVGRNVVMDNERSGLIGFYNYRYRTDPLDPASLTTAQIGNNNGTAAIAATNNQNAWSLIGHGGWDVDQVAGDNDDPFFHPAYRTADKVGNINVRALGDLTMRGGDTLYRWSAIGHFANGNGLDRSYFSAADNISGLRLGGTVNVEVAGNLSLDASFAQPRNRNPQPADGLGLPAQLNPVQIGHGGVFDVRNYVVVDSDNDPALDMNGIGGVQSDITVRAGRDLSILGGRGAANSYAQVGHGFVTDLPDALRYRGQTIGLSGNIKTVVGRNLTMTGGTNLAVAIPGGIPAAAALGTARIGHNLLTRLGDIQVSVGNNATFNRSAVGHAAYQNLSSLGSNTFLAVSRTQPSYRLGGSGVFTSTSGDIFASGGTGQLRIYMPNRPNNAIAAGTVLNGFFYTDPDVTDPPDSGLAVSLEAGDARGDEYLNYFEHTISLDAQGIPNGTFTPEGPYAAVNAEGGAYGIYYNNSGPSLPPPPPPPPPVVPPVPPPPIDLFATYGGFLGNAFSSKIDVYERQDEYVDGSFFTFSQWRDPQGERPYTVDYIGGLGLGSASVVNLRGFVVPVPLNLKEELPVLPNSSTLPQTLPGPGFKTETQGAGVQTQTPPAENPFGAPAPAGAAPAMSDPFGTPPPPATPPAGAPAMSDPFGTPPGMSPTPAPTTPPTTTPSSN